MHGKIKQIASSSNVSSDLDNKHVISSIKKMEGQVNWITQ